QLFLSDKFLCGQVWIPACAGMTNFEIAVLSGMTDFKITVLSDGFRDYGVVGTQLNRHSHESGNLESRGFSHFR
ncbi:hypothetical protein, partial [Neisseria meningitidis]|uniref:hypothetical protein n=1 Tax=Neisseria meningitidis TaxID=487 RepID=UPI001E350A86